MFISPALEELTEERHMSGQTGTSGAAPSDLTNLQQELASQLASVDQAKFHQVKQAIKSAVQDQRDSADIHTVVQVSALTSGCPLECQLAYTCKLEAVLPCSNRVCQSV